jgi:hypothetical protein
MRLPARDYVSPGKSEEWVNCLLTAKHCFSATPEKISWFYQHGFAASSKAQSSLLRHGPLSRLSNISHGFVDPEHDDGLRFPGRQ